MKNFFKPEDFYSIYHDSNNFNVSAAKVANEKLNALVESWPVVYSRHVILGNYVQWTKHPERAAHKARLAFVEEIFKPPCKHAPKFYNSDTNTGFCFICGVELVAEWKAKT